MKNFLKTTLYFFAFAIAGILFQISCSNSDSTNNTQSVNSTPIGKILYNTNDKVWIANYDGSNATQIPIVLPTNVFFNFNSPNSTLSISPDGNTVFFSCLNLANANGTNDLYSCSVNGGNATLVIASGGISSQSVGNATAY